MLRRIEIGGDSKGVFEETGMGIIVFDRLMVRAGGQGM